jgi:hypothetical protein
MDKKTTQMIKGVAILFMILHHVLIQDYWRVTGAPVLSNFEVGIGSIFKICVAMYAFITGYTYLFASKKTYAYGIEKISSLLSRYWLQVLVVFLPISIAGGYRLSIAGTISDLFGVTPYLNCLSWYVYFYIVLPLLFKKENTGVMVIVYIGCALIGYFAYDYYLEHEQVVLQVLTDFCFYFQCVIVGYMTAKYKLYEKLAKRFCVPFWIDLGGILFVLVVKRFANHFTEGRGILGFNTDAILVFALLCFLADFFKKINWRPLEKMMGFVGKYATEMWFFHAVFFSPYTSRLVQPMLVRLRWWPVMYVGIVLVSLVGSVIFEKIYNAIRKVLTKEGAVGCQA